MRKIVSEHGKALGILLDRVEALELACFFCARRGTGARDSHRACRVAAAAREIARRRTARGGAKVLLVDTARFDTAHRAGVFLALGLILLAGAWAYSRLTKRFEPETVQA